MKFSSMGLMVLCLTAMLALSLRRATLSNLLMTARLLIVLGLGLSISGCKEKPPADAPPPPGEEGEKLTAENAKLQFYEAIKAGDVEKMKAAAKIDSSLVNSKEGGKPALHEAVGAGQKAAVTMLLAAKANVNAKDGTGGTALHQLANSENTELAALLIAAKADVNARDNSGATPLHVAAVNGQRPMVEFLISNKADASIKAKDGSTPFSAARKAEKGDVAIILYNQEQIALKAAASAAADKKTFESQKKRAAEGQSTAQFDLGMRYYRGTGVEKDDAQAREWFKKAAASGSATATRMLKEMDEKSGKGEAKEESSQK